MLGATLTGRQVSIIRAVAKYLRQGGIGFSDTYIGRTLLGHADIVRLLIRLFDARLDPDARDDDAAERFGKEIEEALDAVPSLDEDRILRSFLSVVRAIVRTNAFQNDADGKPHPYLSFKLDSSRIPVLPLPKPQFEIFVYSPRVEGVHLRGGKVARGGLRWSDRPEDFRTEVLGLMKAQMVKNALIVPVGAKGGFVVKRPPAEGGREALQQEGIACYKAFLSGMLDITDNIVEGEVVAPKRVVRYDDDDPYLVVAADKGTATFSDIANGVSQSYGFWLGDAFASGGSNGYDHKTDGDHRARRVGVGQAPFPRARRRHPDDRLHGGRDRGHVRRRVRQRNAVLAPHQAGGRVQPHARVPRSRPGSGDELQRAQASVRPAALGLERLRRVADLRGRRRVLRAPPSRSRSAPRSARS